MTEPGPGEHRDVVDPLLDRPDACRQPADPLVGASTVTERQASDKVGGGGPTVGRNSTIAPLDREDCPGLCIVCGLPLDEGTHDHPDDDIDPRLEALRGFQPD